MKVYITKYALTTGVYIAKVEETSSEGMVELPAQPANNTYAQYFHGEGKEWHKTKQSAIARVEQMKAAKLKAIHKQIDKINKISLDLPELGD